MESDRIRALTERGDSVGSCEIARIEFAAAVQRHLREGNITEKERTLILKEFERDVQNGHWTLFPCTQSLVKECAAVFAELPPRIFLRSLDALHIVCAKNNGFKSLYTNDAHLLKALPHFGLKPGVI